MEFITRLEELILLAIWKLQNNAYGVTINDEVSKQANRDYSMGALYFTLDQLLKKGYVNKYPGPPIPERRGRGRLFYTLTDEGKMALNRVRDLQESIWKDIPRFRFEDET